MSIQEGGGESVKEEDDAEEGTATLPQLPAGKDGAAIRARLTLPEKQAVVPVVGNPLQVQPAEPVDAAHTGDGLTAEGATCVAAVFAPGKSLFEFGLS